MKVRVFVPVDGSAGQYEAGDFHFEAIPLKGQFLRLFTPEPGDYPVERIGFIQEERYFVTAVWVARPPVEAWISQQEEADEAAEAGEYPELTGEIPLGPR
jgi:hypothetical protein